MDLTTHNPLAWIDDSLAELEESGLRRELGTFLGPAKTRLLIDGCELVNFGSNDYLSLAGDPRLVAAAAAAAEREGWGAGASPLVTGRTAAQHQLERRLAEFEEVDAALVFSSGYAANMGSISALVGRGDMIFADEKNHASMIDGCRLSRARVQTYPHADWRALERLLAAHADGGRILIATESVFSMDGDAAPLVELASLAERYGAMLLVDEAHATGVFGPTGRGLCEELNVGQQVQVRVGTLSKALAGQGGFVAGSQALIDWLVQRARPYVFSTAPPAPVCAAAEAALGIVTGEPQRRSALLEQAAALRGQLTNQGWNVGQAVGPIIPLVVGHPQRAMLLSERLRDRGFLVPAIRPPSVAVGESRLRISLNAGHTADEIGQLIEALRDLSSPS